MAMDILRKLLKELVLSETFTQLVLGAETVEDAVTIARQVVVEDEIVDVDGRWRPHTQSALGPDNAHLADDVALLYANLPQISEADMAAYAKECVGDHHPSLEAALAYVRGVVAANFQQWGRATPPLTYGQCAVITALVDKAILADDEAMLYANWKQ